MYVVELLRSWSRPRVLVLAVSAASLAACSSESTRFNEGLFSSRAPSGTEVTGSTPARAPSGRVESQPLPPATQHAPVASRPGTVSSRPGEVGAVGGAALSHPSRAPADVTGSVPQRAAGQWTWDGGTAVTVSPGETVEMIARRHGVPASIILQANNIAAPQGIQPGQRLVIPRYVSQAPAADPRTASRSAIAATPAPASTHVHVVAPGETLTKISRLYAKSLTDVAKANNIAPHTKVNIGDRIVIPGVRANTAQRKAGVPLAAQRKANTPAPQSTAASVEAPQSASVVTPANETAAPTGSTRADATPSFRWPVRGRVITGFGPSPNGQQNDGINLAVPEGTPIKAAEDGVVAYAGNELKGYGNLVLVRHANGYVTAYAHAKELLVKRGDQIKRGQVIAHSGQTGNVNAPQLHFEVRKGPSPVDPLPLLTGG
jgi:murein DD-endopeptidase MepM/ murein hydrolase activator NlpD